MSSPQYRVIFSWNPVRPHPIPRKWRVCTGSWVDCNAGPVTMPASPHNIEINASETAAVFVLEKVHFKRSLWFDAGASMGLWNILLHTTWASKSSSQWSQKPWLYSACATGMYFSSADEWWLCGASIQWESASYNSMWYVNDGLLFEEFRFLMT